MNVSVNSLESSGKQWINLFASDKTLEGAQDFKTMHSLVVSAAGNQWCTAGARNQFTGYSALQAVGRRNCKVWLNIKEGVLGRVNCSSRRPHPV
jgi:hypothetical protein